MSMDTERLIESLAAKIHPVRRLQPPAIRGGAWLLAVGSLILAAIFLFSDRDTFLRRAQDPTLVTEMVGTLLTGIGATVAAFHLSVPDRSPAWALLPLPSFVLWIASSGYSCYRHWIVLGPEGWELGESAQCFRFILGVSLPLAASVLMLLRLASPLTPARVAALAGVGVAAIAAFSLQFFHPFDITFMDLAVHAIAIAIVVAVMTMTERLTKVRRA